MENEIDAWQKIKKYVLDNVDTLRSKYRNSYLAFSYNGEILSSDANKFNLARKVKKEVFITSIDDILNPKTIEMDSLEVGRTD